MKKIKITIYITSLQSMRLKVGIYFRLPCPWCMLKAYIALHKRQNFLSLLGDETLLGCCMKTSSHKFLFKIWVSNKCNNWLDCSPFHYKGKCFVKINSFHFLKSLSNELNLELICGAIGFLFHFIHPFCCDYMLLLGGD